MALVDLFLDPLTGDLDLTDSQVRLTSNVEECVRQKVEITLRAFRGEWGFNIDFGVPYLENDNNPIQLMGKTSKSFFDVTVRTAIEGVEGIVQVTSFESTLDQGTDKLSIVFTAITESGEVISPTSPITFQI